VIGEGYNHNQNSTHKLIITITMASAKSFIWLLAFVSICTSSIATKQQCTNTDVPLSLELMTDNFPAETSWNVKSAFDNSIVLKSGPYSDPLTLHNETYCLISTGCLEFNIIDSFGDGICCEDYQGNGYYRVFYDNTLIKEGGAFDKYETSLKFGDSCPLDDLSTPPQSTSKRSIISTASSLSTATASVSSTGRPLWMDPPLPTCGSGPAAKYLVYYGNGPHKSPLKECAGHCNTDSECDLDLVCFQRDEDVIKVPGCYAVPFEKLSYCVSQAQFDSSYSKPLPLKPSISSPIHHRDNNDRRDNSDSRDKRSGDNNDRHDKSGGESISQDAGTHKRGDGFDHDTILLILFSAISTLVISFIALVYLLYKFVESIWKEIEIHVQY